MDRRFDFVAQPNNQHRHYDEQHSPDCLFGWGIKCENTLIVIQSILQGSTNIWAIILPIVFSHYACGGFEFFETIDCTRNGSGGSG